MTDIIVSPEPTVTTRNYLVPIFPDVEFAQTVPAEMPELLVTITDTGGAGRHDVVMDEVRLTFDVYGPTSGEASELARDLFGVLWAWPDLHQGVYRRRGWARPAWLPDDATRRPRYVFTATFDFRGAVKSI